MANEENGWTKVLVRMPTPYRDWLMKRTMIESTDLTKLIRRLIRDEMKRVDPDAWTAIEAQILNEAEADDDEQRGVG